MVVGVLYLIIGQVGGQQMLRGDTMVAPGKVLVIIDAAAAHMT